MSYYSYNDYSIRILTENDCDMLLEHRNNFTTWKNLTYILPISEEGQKNWVRNIGFDRTKMYFVARRQKWEEGVILVEDDIGIVRIDEIDYLNDSCRIGCDVFCWERSKGHTKGIMNLIIDFCFNQLGMNRLWLLVLDDNTKAIKAYKSVGFKKEGVQRQAIFRDGKYHDYQMYSLLKGEQNDTTI